MGGGGALLGRIRKHAEFGKSHQVAQFGRVFFRPEGEQLQGISLQGGSIQSIRRDD